MKHTISLLSRVKPALLVCSYRLAHSLENFDVGGGLGGGLGALGGKSLFEMVRESGLTYIPISANTLREFSAYDCTQTTCVVCRPRQRWKWRIWRSLNQVERMPPPQRQRGPSSLTIIQTSDPYSLFHSQESVPALDDKLKAPYAALPLPHSPAVCTLTRPIPPNSSHGFVLHPSSPPT